VTLYLHTTLQRQTPAGFQRRLELTVPTASCLADLLDEVGVEGGGDTVLLVVNGRTATLNHRLSDGDEIHLIPAISGGLPPEMPDQRQELPENGHSCRG
jgi:sulfur carrier protein ThiS